MEQLLNSRARSIQISGIRKFFNEVAKYPDAISLTLGQPDFPTPLHVKEAAIQAIHNNQTVYSHNAGYEKLRKAATTFVNEKYDLQYNHQNEVIVTAGASEAIDITLRAILSEGDEVLLPAPVYPGYEPVITLCGAKAIYMDTTETAFKVTPDLVKEAITPKTKAIILPFPSNPTGVTLEDYELEALADYLSKQEIFVLSDEIYSELRYNGKHRSIATYEGMRDKTFVINGLSKSHSMTGWRIGFLFAPSNILQHVLKVHQYNVTCASTISQAAAIEALTNGKDDAALMRNEYNKRLQFCSMRLEQMGINFVKPNGAFYLFIPVLQFGLSSYQFALNLLRQEHIAVVPGDAFSTLGEGYIRISYAASLEQLEKGMNGLEKFIKTLC
ncbi:aminotransferase A [Fictibacillus phosphorivorans]|uniref:aminotransferase A n=1 Tax=Fictibacillus phosphorivorans TaxID=1221500 RepID=UPI00203D7276|nr:aminotransferase A [Fictibacillus phosphorivorans]MCM3719604.1 aminotransferase A [Fictibacillus phosphorivorans]MCM3777322.1 aminotransferase A [Fictibacillus phosphorivorans]